MTIPQTVLTRMAKLHPHSATILNAFVPLLEAQDALAQDLPAPALPPLDHATFSQGKAWLPLKGGDLSVYLDEAFLKEAPKSIGAAASKGFPDLKDGIRVVRDMLAKDPDRCRELAAFGLQGQHKKIKAWAKKLELNADVASLFAMHLAGAAAKRVEKAASGILLPEWSKEYCPVCGSRPHGSCLRTKEGKRFLQCSLCRHEWGYSRTTCPACGQDNPKELLLFFHDEAKYERAEVCNICKHYILNVDTRELAGDTPVELYFLCMTHLDLLMQEKEYTPVSYAE